MFAKLAPSKTGIPVAFAVTGTTEATVDTLIKIAKEIALIFIIHLT